MIQEAIERVKNLKKTDEEAIDTILTRLNHLEYVMCKILQQLQLFMDIDLNKREV